MNNNYLKFLKLILKKNTLLRVLQIYECFDINLYGTSIEFGAIDNKDKTKLDDFFNLLKKEKIYFPVPEKKEEIEGVSIPKILY